MVHLINAHKYLMQAAKKTEPDISKWWPVKG